MAKRLPPKSRIKVERRKLGQHNAVGLAFKDENRVVIDPDQSAFSEMDTHIHEFLHIADKRMSEEKVGRISLIISENLWRAGYRKVVLT